MKVFFKPEGFNGFLGDESEYLPISVTLTDLARAIITAGRSGWPDATKGGRHRVYEIAGLLLKTMAYVEETENGLRTTDLYWELDATEKGAASYRIGMGIAKVVAEQKLKVPWLRHVDPLIHQGIVQTSLKTHERPDMVGLGRNNEWHVIEAKGRSSSDASAREKGLRQAAAVHMVAGYKPKTKCACIAHFGWNPFCVDLINTTDVGREDFSGVSPERFQREYYGFIHGMTQTNSPASYSVPGMESDRNTGMFRIFAIPGTRMAVGVQERIYEQIILNNNQEPAKFWADFYSDEKFLNWFSSWQEYRQPMQLKQGDRYEEQDISIGTDGYILLRSG